MRYLLLFVMTTLTAVGQSTKPDPNIVWFPNGGYACGHPDQPSTTPCRMPTDAEIAAHMPKKHKAHPGFKQTPCANLAASDVQIQDSGKCYVPIKKLDFIYICSPCATSHLLQFENPVDDGVAHWQAPKQSPGLTAIAEAIMEVCRKYCTGDGNCMVCDQKQPPVAEAITCEGCGSGDNLPLTVNKESCKGKWSDDTKTCYLVEQLGAVGAMMEQIAPEKAVVRDGGCNWCQKDGPCTLRACPKTPESKLQYGWLVPDPIKTTQDGYDCTMGRTLKTITISCTLKEK